METWSIGRRAVNERRLARRLKPAARAGATFLRYPGGTRGSAGSPGGSTSSPGASPIGVSPRSAWLASASSASKPSPISVATGAKERRWCTRRPERGERAEVLGHAVAHVALEAVARMGGADLHHQAVARHLGDDRGGRDREHQRVAAHHRLAVAAARRCGRCRRRRRGAAAPAGRAPRARAPTARPGGCCRDRCARATRRRRRPARSRRYGHRASRAARRRASWNR